MILNSTKKTVISENAFIAKNFFDKTLGMIRKENRKGIIFKTRFGVHTFLMREAIDILVLDKELKVVKMKKNLLPNKIFAWNPSFNLIIELPRNSLKKSGTEIGDKISF